MLRIVSPTCQASSCAAQPNDALRPASQDQSLGPFSLREENAGFRRAPNKLLLSPTNGTPTALPAKSAIPQRSRSPSLGTFWYPSLDDLCVCRNVAAAACRRGESKILERAANDSPKAHSLGEGFSRDALPGAFAFPFVIFAKARLVFFHLGFDFAEGFFAACAEMSVLRSGVQSAGRQIEI